MPLKANVAVVPVKVMVVTAVPLFHNVTPVMLTGFPVPDTDRVTAVIFTAEVVLGSVNRTC